MADKIMKTLMGYEVYDEVSRNKIEVLETDNETSKTRINELETGKADVSHTHSIEDIVGGDGALPIENGGTGATNAVAALNNLGIFWGTEEAPETGTPNTIYIQIN